MNFLTLNCKKRLLCGLLGFFLISCIYYAFLPSGGAAFPRFSGIYLAQFLIYFGILRLLKDVSLNTKWIVGIAIVARVILIFTAPTLENDFWRYLWDGRVLAHGINPYTYKPLDPALDFLDVPYRRLIGWKNYGTIYPPVSILVFAVVHLMAGDSLTWLKVSLTLFDLGTGGILILWFKRLGISPKWCALYFLNPLVLKEVSNSAHLDSIVVFFSVLATYLMWGSDQFAKGSMKKSLAAWIYLAVAVASKIYPICFVPFFFKVDRRRWFGLFIFIVLLGIAYGPFISAGINILNGTEAFARHWIFNASMYRVFQDGIPIVLSHVHNLGLVSLQSQNVLLKDDLLAKFIVAFIFGLFTLYRAKKISTTAELPSELVNVIGALLVLSPVVNGWYVLWILPFACLVGNKPWLLFSFLVMASYSWWYSKELAPTLRWFEYLVFYAVLFLWHIRTKEKLAKIA